jgi:hypothetical protein
MSSGILQTSDLFNYTICSLPQSRETIPLINSPKKALTNLYIHTSGDFFKKSLSEISNYKIRIAVANHTVSADIHIKNKKIGIIHFNICLLFKK